MTDLRSRIAAVLTSHLTDEAQYRCWCGLVTGGDEGYTRHVADAVIRELRLADDPPPYCMRCGAPHRSPCKRKDDT